MGEATKTRRARRRSQRKNRGSADRRGGYNRRAFPQAGRGAPATINVPNHLLTWLEAVALGRDISRSGLIVTVLMEWAERRGFKANEEMPAA